ETEKTHYLVMEYADNGTLREYLQNNKLEWPEKIRMSYLHEIGICIGVTAFIDPRKFEDANYRFDKSDVYSIGTVMWVISSDGCPPFSQRYDYCPLLSIQGLPIIGTPTQYINLYSKCWDGEPNNRPLIMQVVQQLNSLELDPKYDGTNLKS
ncbi:11109_t:CDS:2, partial [Racocetra fulgida]